jgi:hypothetical protein
MDDENNEIRIYLQWFGDNKNKAMGVVQKYNSVNTLSHGQPATHTSTKSSYSHLHK